LQAARKELSGITKQKSKLETLCRTLTDERAKLKARLGEGAPPAEGDAAASE
jgi:predicted nuclease with TOPRIM domain